MFTVPRINSVNLLFSHALGARLGRFRNYVTAQPMQVTISSVFWIFPVVLYNEFSVKFDLTVSMSRPLEPDQNRPMECFLPVSSEKPREIFKEIGGRKI